MGMVGVSRGEKEGERVQHREFSDQSFIYHGSYADRLIVTLDSTLLVRWFTGFPLWISLANETQQAKGIFRSEKGGGWVFLFFDRVRGNSGVEFVRPIFYAASRQVPVLPNSSENYK